MNRAVNLLLPQLAYDRLVHHLLPKRPTAEEAAFIYARFDGNAFEFLDWFPVPPEEFLHRSLYHIELSDACRARTIKRAHDLNSSIIEFHSHPKARFAEFSSSDRAGFSEYVPHVWWRLEKRPYAAFVFGPSTFDSLAWLTNPQRPCCVADISTGGKLLKPTGLTLTNGDSTDDHEI